MYIRPMRHAMVLAVFIGLFVAADHIWFRGDYSRDLWMAARSMGDDFSRWVQGSIDRGLSR
jgi:hypothetical protein